MHSEIKSNPIFDFFKPKTKSFFLEGLRLALLNAVILFLGGTTVFLLLRGAELLRGRGFPLPLPLWLILLPFGIFFYITWFKFGRTFGKQVSARRFIKGYAAGIIGQTPGVALMYFFSIWIQESLLVPELLRIGLIIITTLNVVLPIMVGLGCMDQKKKSMG